MDHIKQKKTSFCTNCSKLNHEYKECRDPVTSYGIILINLKNQLANFNKDFINLIKSGNKFELDEYGIKVNSYKDIEKFSMYSNLIDFLMIQRKHTLGYIEFIRGRYNIDNIDGIVYLFQQMTPHEIELIAKNDFDKLWKDFWGNSPPTHQYAYNEHEKSKEKFNILKNEEDELSLSFYVNNVRSAWAQSEWDFLKVGEINKKKT